MRFDAGCSCSVFLGDAATRRDPTGTSVVRTRYEADMVRRFRALRALIREAVLSLDVLGLSRPGGVSASVFDKAFRVLPPARVLSRDAAPPPAGAFQFIRNSEKVAGFMQWLRDASREGILEIVEGTSMTAAANASWQNVYIDTAYQKGIRDAAGAAGSARDYDIRGAFNRPVHADRIGLIYTRAFEELRGVTDTMATQMSRVLAQGLAEGRGPQRIARDLVDRVDRIGITRARVIARTETISAHAEGMLNTFEEMKVEGVKVLAEFATARDDKVCPECEELEGQEYTIQEARGLIPVHPNCRCTYIPVVVD